VEIKILGSGCAKCQSLEANAVEAVAALGVADATEVTHVRDEVEILSYGVMTTPALVVDDEVIVAGRVASADQIRELLRVRRQGS
jgi:small redox-active disulfide protein 2